jgi:ABC-2 type transport system ATP-binding protein
LTTDLISADNLSVEASPEEAQTHRSNTSNDVSVQQAAENTATIKPTKLRVPVLELDRLSVTFDRPILDNLSAKMYGNCIGLLGPNGAGKTTLLNTLLGFNRRTTGRASILGHDLTKDNQFVRSMIGYMPERDSFVAGMSGVRFVRLMAELSGLSSKVALERAHEVFFYVGLGEARYRKVESFSLGMKQLVKLAQAIVHGPKILFLDEPTNGLDPPARARMLQLIREIRDSGDTQIIIASHLLQDIESCCDEVLVLKDGKVAKYCNLEEERRSNKQFLLMQIRGNEEGFVEGLRKLGCEVALPNRRRIKAIIPQGVEIQHLYALAESLSVQIRNLDYKRDSLEDIFLRAMEED